MLVFLAVLFTHTPYTAEAGLVTWFWSRARRNLDYSWYDSVGRKTKNYLNYVRLHVITIDAPLRLLEKSLFCISVLARALCAVEQKSSINRRDRTCVSFRERNKELYSPHEK